jgi:cytochrome oxidase Cu insertion factor (SCO1/SenC/PrrC family)
MLFNHDFEMSNNTTFVLVAIVAALAMFGVVMVTVASTMQLQEAEARPNTPVRSCDAGGVAFNASQGRCFNP